MTQPYQGSEGFSEHKIVWTQTSREGGKEEQSNLGSVHAIELSVKAPLDFRFLVASALESI